MYDELLAANKTFLKASELPSYLTLLTAALKLVHKHDKDNRIECILMVFI